MSKNKKQSWIVRLKCVVIKEVVTTDCTEEQAYEEPFSHAISEQEIEMRDWEVEKVEPNE